MAGGSGDVFGAPAVVRCFCSPHELGWPVSTIQHRKHASPRAKSHISLLCRSSSRTPTGVLGMRVMRGSAAWATEHSSAAGICPARPLRSSPGRERCPLTLTALFLSLVPALLGEFLADY